MSKPTFINSSVVYNDHSTEYNIDARGKADIPSIIRACDAQEVTPEPATETPAEKPRKATTLPFLVVDKLNELGTYTIEEFEQKYHKAVKGGAPQLANFLKRYSELKVFNLEGYSKRATYDELKDFFGDEMDFGYTNFTLYY